MRAERGVLDSAMLPPSTVDPRRVRRVLWCSLLPLPGLLGGLVFQGFRSGRRWGVKPGREVVSRVLRGGDVQSLWPTFFVSWLFTCRECRGVGYRTDWYPMASDCYPVSFFVPDLGCSLPGAVAHIVLFWGISPRLPVAVYRAFLPSITIGSIRLYAPPGGPHVGPLGASVRLGVMGVARGR